MLCKHTSRQIGVKIRRNNKNNQKIPKTTAEQPNPGDIVTVKIKDKKHTARDSYLVTENMGKKSVIHKIIHQHSTDKANLRSKSYITDNKRLHEQEVANAAAKAKEELAAQNPNLKLKHDPTKDIRIPAQPVNHQGQVEIPNIKFLNIHIFVFSRLPTWRT